ncbi:MAG: 6-hydroxymethylpterin diphosphokinase MptE-like protein [Treponema sp.]
MPYAKIIFSKDNHPVPVFTDGKAAHSRYAPVKEGENFAARIEKSGFFLCAGLAGGYHVEALLKKFPDAAILAVEQSADDIRFLQSNIENVRTLIEEKRIFAVPLDMAERALIERYLPALHGNFALLDLPGWKAANPAAAKRIEEAAKSALKKIAADFSVQSNFGKIWQRNIVLNLKSAAHNRTLRFPLYKTAFIAAAGPSLDSKIDFVKAKRDDFYVIATDTAYSSLRARGIFCDAVCSLDGQSVSCAHFHGNLSAETLFVFDVCAEHSAARRAANVNARVVFNASGHPLASYAEASQNGQTFIHAGRGAGTVTIMAADFALKAGFQKIIVAGADFAYLEGRPYAKGTYLDFLYGSAQNRLSGIEGQFCCLMFRTPLTRNGIRASNEVLESYRRDFERWAETNGLELTRSDGFYSLYKKNPVHSEIKIRGFDFERFKNAIKNTAKDFMQSENVKNSPAAVFTLPFIAHLKKKNPDADFTKCVKLALDTILRYTF